MADSGTMDDKNTIIIEHGIEETIVAMSNTSSLSEQEMIGMEYTELECDTIQGADTDVRPIKRGREEEEEEEEEWSVVKNKEKKLRPGSESETEIYISSNERMPKQFALAKLLKNSGITDIQKVKYLNPFKIRVTITNETSLENLEKCTEIIDRGWRVQRAMEVNLSYGVIKDVDLEMSEQDILSNISCPGNAQLAAVYRLKRRCSEGDGWKPSESVRLTFKGSFLPAFINVDGLRIRVEPYVFPVSQCSHCWKLGHTTKRCPFAKVICPKCGDNHSNCETTSYKCTNCGGPHMALARSCPAFLKEKKLREIMAEFNCTYRRALTMFVPSARPAEKTPIIEQAKPEQTISTPGPSIAEYTPSILSQGPSFAQVVTHAIVHKENSKNTTPRLSKKQKRIRERDPYEFESEIPTEQETCDSQEKPPKEEKEEKKDVKFSELLGRLKEIIFLRGATMQVKVQSIIKCCLEWVILVVVENISDWPILKIILDYVHS